jgi:hypothetical protein
VTLGNTSILKTILQGNVGIGTSSPGVKLDVVNGGLRALSATVSGLGNSGNVFIMANNSGDLYATSTASASSFIKSVYVASTAATSTGDNNGVPGYVAANNLCNTASTGSHVCTPDEILNTISSGLGSRIPIAQIWIFSGPPGYTANAMDCGGRTVGLGVDNYGTTWYKSATNGEGYGSLAFCNQGYKLACCK